LFPSAFCPAIAACSVLAPDPRRSGVLHFFFSGPSFQEINSRLLSPQSPTVFFIFSPLRPEQILAILPKCPLGPRKDEALSILLSTDLPFFFEDLVLLGGFLVGGYGVFSWVVERCILVLLSRSFCFDISLSFKMCREEWLSVFFGMD